MNGVVLLLMYGKRRQWPVRNLHDLAKAVEKGDEKTVEKFYKRLDKEVTFQLSRNDLLGTVELMSELSDENFEEIDRLMQEHE